MSQDLYMRRAYPRPLGARAAIADVLVISLPLLYKGSVKKTCGSPASGTGRVNAAVEMSSAEQFTHEADVSGALPA
jgi:hypothetical protein